MKIGDTISVLDKGYVTWLGAFGTDETVVIAARTSTDGASRGYDADRKLIRYLMRHGHTSPFEMVEFSFMVKAPLFVFRQWQRHRMAEYNEWSARYSELQDEFYIPNTWRTQSKKNHQGSNLPHEHSDYWNDILNKHCQESMKLYQGALQDGVAREMARMFLPVNIYSKMMVKMNAHALMHFINLRADDHAQWEIQAYARVLETVLKIQMPITYEAYSDEKNRRRDLSD